MIDSKIRSNLGEKTLVMGILNITPDSFSDGGIFFSPKSALARAYEMEEEGVDIIDIGGESTRPGAQRISTKEELKRITPVIKKIVDNVRIPISIDTYKSKVAEKALRLGAAMINDVTALRNDPKMGKIVAKYDVPICLMHMKGTPKTMQNNPSYTNLMEEIKNFLKKRIDYAVSQGIDRENIIIDPGIGFGKRTGKNVEDNCEILRNLSEIKKLNQPVLIGTSRKKFIGNVCSQTNKPLPVSDRLEGSLTAATVAVINGANILRVHDVKETRRCLKLLECILK